MNNFASRLNLQISEYYNERLRRDYKLPNLEEIITHTQQQKRYEKKYLSKARVCGKTPQITLSDIDVDNVSMKMKNNFYDVNFMESMRCIINLITDSSLDDMQERIRFFFANLKQFGSPSVNGIALRTSLREKSNHYKSDFLVLKAPQNPSKSAELLHEAVVGITLNKLRAEIPNFSYVYDIFDCSVPIVNTSKEVQLWCTAYDTPVSYVVYEYVQDSISMEATAQKGSPRDTFLYYLQVLMACNMAHQRFDFTHYDLHHENVLIRQYSENPFYLQYSFKGDNYYLISPGGIATMIDYGMSHVKTGDGFNIGVLSNDGFYARNDVYAENSHITGDAYKLLGFILYDAVMEGHTELYPLGISLFSFFFQDPESEDFHLLDVETFEKIVKEQRKYYYQLPFVTEFNFDFETYIEYVLHVLKREFPDEILVTLTPPAPENLFGCAENCLSVRQSLKEFHLHPSKMPTFFEVYDDRENPKQAILSNFLKNYIAATQSEVIHLQEILDFEIPSIYIIKPTISDDQVIRLLQNNFILFNENVTSLSTLLNNYQTVQSYINSITYLLTVEKITKISDLNNSLQDILKKIQKKKKEFEKIIFYAKDPVHRLSLFLERAVGMLKNPNDEVLILNDSYSKLDRILSTFL